jgi:hypothetical protein
MGSTAADKLTGTAMLPRRYTQAHKEAIIGAYVVRGMTAGQVVGLATCGELVHPSGGRLAPFSVGENSVRSIATRARRAEAAAEAATELLDMPARDAVEVCRRRLLTVIDSAMDYVEIELDAGRWPRGDIIRQLCRATWELAAIPGPYEPPPAPPGAKADGVRRGGETRGGLAGPIVAAFRAGRGW